MNKIMYVFSVNVLIKLANRRVFFFGEILKHRLRLEMFAADLRAFTRSIYNRLY